MNGFEGLGNAITGFFSLEIAGNYLSQYVEAIIAFIVTLVVIKIFKYIVIHRLHELAKKTKTEFDDVLIEAIKRIGWPFYLVASTYAALHFVQLPEMLNTGFRFLLIIVVVYYGIRIVQSVLGYWLKKAIAVKAGRTVTSFFDTVIKIALWSIALLLILQNMGFEITTLIAGLGIVGIAIAFALQRVLEDIFSAFSIFYDKPFEVGDFIIIGNDLGTVKDIGLKTTRINHLKGQELVVSNREMTSARIHNYKKMKKRRITFSFGITYDTPLRKMKKIPKIVKNIFKDIKLAEIDRVHFKSYGDFSLIYEVVYYMQVPDYNTYMDTQQEVNLALKEAFEKEKIEFAYPTQTIYYSKMK